MQNQTEIAGTKAWELHQSIQKNELERRRLLLENMSLIHDIHSNGLYKVILGDDNAQWSAYLGQHEVFYTRSKVYTLDKIYQKFIKQLKLDPSQISEIPLTKLSALLPIVDDQNVLYWIAQAEALTSQDFNDELRKSQGKISYLECPHSNTKLYTICSSCGFRHQGNHEEMK